jgi:formylmethanofuran dehydrogenase subunit E
MEIGTYSFEEFLERVERFHGYPAPGLMVAAYMTEKAKSLLPPDAMVNAIAETSWCLPDAIQLLTTCTVGNGRLKIINLNLYALSLYDKSDGRGQRVWIDPGRLDPYPQVKTWFLKLKPKKEQDTTDLLAQIRAAGSSICISRPIVVQPEFLAKRQKGALTLCPLCGEAYPVSDGGVCRLCQGEGPYFTEGPTQAGMAPWPAGPGVAAVPVDDAVGKKALHDMTMIVPGESKGPEFRKGQEITCSDLTRLKRMGRRTVYVQDDGGVGSEWVHEDEVAAALGPALAGEGVVVQGAPSEGKVTLVAERDGLFLVDEPRLESFNFIPEVMCASRKGFSVVKKGAKLAGARAIPLFLRRDLFHRAMAVLGGGPLFQVAPLRRAKAGILITGNEVYEGVIPDKFEPIIRGKVRKFGGETVKTIIVPDECERVKKGVEELIAAGADIVITTAGLSVDPDDVTRQGLLQAGASDVLYGAPILPGAMTLVARIKEVQVLGVPACALFFKTTSLDLLLPRLLAGLAITRKDLAKLANGAMCHECRKCTYPKCAFGK